MVPIDIDVDWNTMDDTGLPWTSLDEAPDPTKIVADAFVVAGRGNAIAVVEVVDVGEDGVVHLQDVGGTVEENLYRVRQGKPVS
jgi:hypothetical protein